MRSTLTPPPSRPVGDHVRIVRPSRLPPPPPAPWRRRRAGVVLACLALAIVGLVSASVYAPAGVLVLFAVLTPIERRWRRHEQPVMRRGLRADIAHALLGGVATIVAFVVVLGPPLLLVAPLIPSVPTFENAIRTWPGWMQAVGALLVLDLLAYIAHRCAHEVKWLWRFHRVHHSSRRLDWIAGLRNHPLDTVLPIAVVIVPFQLLGFREDMLGAFAVAQGLIGIWFHANVRWRWRRLDGRIANPEFHHWHHSNHPEAWNHNYAAFLPLWDRVFGTYYMPDDRRPLIYGIDDPMPDTWWGQMREPLRRRRHTSPDPVPGR